MSLFIIACSLCLSLFMCVAFLYLVSYVCHSLCMTLCISLCRGSLLVISFSMYKFISFVLSSVISLCLYPRSSFVRYFVRPFCIDEFRDLFLVVSFVRNVVISIYIYLFRVFFVIDIARVLCISSVIYVVRQVFRSSCLSSFIDVFVICLVI